MLVELTIRDFAIIDELHLSFGPGFTVLTGETGAGKSIIVDAVDLLLGGRADATVVRSEAQRAVVEGFFRLDVAQQAALLPLLEQEELQGDLPDALSLSREVRAGGRTVCRVNGRSVNLALLRQVAEGLVDIHGQSEHLSLLRVREHVNLLDRYAGLWELRERVAALAGRVRAVRSEMAELLRNERTRAQRIDLLEFQIQEIGAAALQPGEDETLAEERVRLANAEQLAELAQIAYASLEEADSDGETPSVVDLLGASIRAIEGLVKIDPSLQPQLDAVEQASYQIEEVARAVRDYQEQVEFNPRRLAWVEERLELIHRLQRKYGATIEDVLAFGEQAAGELEAIGNSEERVESLRAEEDQLLEELGRVALDLSTRRREAAVQLAAGVEAELADLRMEGARFAVDFEWRGDAEGVPVADANLGYRLQVTGSSPALSPTSNLQPETSSASPPGRLAFDATGIDRVEFLISPNPGEPLKPMAKIASGGETSRLMLALKTVLSRADQTPTLVFDEIDQGIGGRVGATVGAKLWALTTPHQGLRHQVLCITHLPQLAGFGDAHYHVEKHVRDERTVTRLRPLTGAERVAELSQMLGTSGEAGTRSAELILEQAHALKGQLSG